MKNVACEHTAADLAQCNPFSDHVSFGQPNTSNTLRLPTLVTSCDSVGQLATPRPRNVPPVTRCTVMLQPQCKEAALLFTNESEENTCCFLFEHACIVKGILVALAAMVRHKSSYYWSRGICYIPERNFMRCTYFCKHGRWTFMEDCQGLEHICWTLFQLQSGFRFLNPISTGPVLGFLLFRTFFSVNWGWLVLSINSWALWLTETMTRGNYVQRNNDVIFVNGFSLNGRRHDTTCWRMWDCSGRN